jgi:PhzF family phenazine biosynthesis protein
MERKIQIVKAFVDNGAGGNAAGVVLDADDLSTADKLAIANAVALSETAFVSRSDSCDVKLEFFTPNRQIAHCGHATIATFGLLRQLGRVQGAHSSKETIDGRREIRFEGAAAFMEQLAPQYEDAADVAGILAAIGAQRADLAELPVVGATGNRFLLVHLEQPAMLSALNPDFPAIAALSEALDVIGFYVFATGVAGFDATARMFAPHYGIDEEAATGTAAGPLACYLYDRAGVRKDTLVIQQGTYMRAPSASRLTARLQLEDGRIAGLFVGGEARVSGTTTLSL